MDSLPPETSTVSTLVNRLPASVQPTEQDLKFVQPHQQIIPGGKREPGEKIQYPFDYTPPIEPEVPRGHQLVDRETVHLADYVLHVTNDEGLSIYHRIPVAQIAFCRRKDSSATMIVTDEKSQVEIDLPPEIGRLLLQNLEFVKMIMTGASEQRNVRLENAMAKARRDLLMADPETRDLMYYLGKRHSLANIKLKMTSSSS